MWWVHRPRGGGGIRVPGGEPATRRCSGLGRERNDEHGLDEVESRGGDVVRRARHSVGPPDHRSPVVSTRSAAAILDNVTADGLFGPDSVTWKVHSSPVMLIGGLRALMIQALHPLAMAGEIVHSDFRALPLPRLDRTVDYVSTVTFADTTTAEAAGAEVRRVHTYIRG